jgi:prolyl 4-hydroxylase
MQVVESPYLLSKSECSTIIELAKKKGVSTAGTVGEEIDGYRTADSCWLDFDDDNIILWLQDYISKVTNLPIENQEHPHIVRYGIGGEYKEHHDWFDINDEVNRDQIGESGNRTHSFLVYLNDDFEGGETEFINLKQTIKPEIGKGLMWTNTKDGECLEDSLHAGLPVTEGFKWILIVWVRENKFIV